MRGAVDGMRTPHPLAPELPGLFQDDPLTVLFVEALDEVLAPVPMTLDNLDAYLSPSTAPEDWVYWLAEWLGVAEGRGLPIEELRRRVAAAAGEQTTAGTVAGLEQMLRDAFGKTVKVQDTGATQWSTTPQATLPGTDEARVSVRIGARVDQDAVRAMVEAHVPPYVRVEVSR
jgi:phage tail-like protein